MKKILLFSLFCSALFSKLSIVFVQLGANTPHYIKTSLEQARLFNESVPIYLITSQAFIEQNRDFLKHLHIHCHDQRRLQKSFNHWKFLRNSTLDKKYRDRFWLYASERFFYIDALAKKCALDSIIHIESDNMIYINFSDYELLLKESYNGIGAVFDSNTRVIPSIVFFKNCKTIDIFTQFLADNTHLNLNDMWIFSPFKKPIQI